MNHEDFFAPLQNTKPYVKMGFKGLKGSGKSKTAVKIAVELAKRIGTTKPIVIFDTELAAHFQRKEILDAGLPVPIVRQSRTFGDLVWTLKFMEEGISDILIIDQAERPWFDICTDYKSAPTRLNPPRQPKLSLEPEDWMFLKGEWRLKFLEPWVDGMFHSIICGRGGFEYEDERDAETGEITNYKSGIKMAGENSTEFEPDCVVLMESIENVLGAEKKILRRATVVKDRSDTIDGQIFDNPTYTNFQPFIDFVLTDPVYARATPSQRSGLSFPTDDANREYGRKCRKACEEIEGVIQHAIPGQAAKDKQLRMEIIYKVFGTHSEQDWQSRSLEELRVGSDLVLDALVALDLAEWKAIGDARSFVVKGLDQLPTHEEFVGGYSRNAESLTPSPLRQAQEGLAQIDSEKTWAASAFSDIKGKKPLALVKAAKDFGWNPEQFAIILQIYEVPEGLKVSDQLFDILQVELARGPEGALKKSEIEATPV